MGAGLDTGTGLGTEKGARRRGMDDLLAIAQAVVDQASAGEEIEVYVARGHETQVRAFDGEVESFSSSDSSGVGIRVLIDGGGEGKRAGFAWAGSLDQSVIATVLDNARDNAIYATSDPYISLAHPDGVEATSLELWDPSFETFSIDAKVALAIDLERQVRDSDVRIRQVSSADYGDDQVEVALASTMGIAGYSHRTSAFLSVSAIAGKGTDSQTGTGFSVGRGPACLDPDHAARDAVLRSTRMLGASRTNSKRCVAVFDSRAVSTLLGVISSAFSGEAVVKGRSFFADRIGECVATSGVTLVDDPTDPRAFSAASRDGEGLACRRNVLVDDGVLQGFLYDTVSGNRAGTASTGSALRGGFATTPTAGCRALVLQPGTLSQDEILGLVGEGIYIQSMTGVHSGVNVVSGDFSVGVEGLMVRDGVLAEPVREITVASTLQRMLQEILYIGSDLEWLPGVAAGQTLAIADMQISGD